MLAGVCMRRRVAVRRVVATERRTAGLARSQVHPSCAYLYALFALSFLWLFDAGDRFDMRASFFRHRFPSVSPLRFTFRSLIEVSHDRLSKLSQPGSRVVAGRMRAE
jgi:hypothetical protein